MGRRTARKEAGVTTNPIHAADAERALIGAALSGYPHLDDLAAIVAPEDFYAPALEDAWRAIFRVHHAGTRPDPITVRMAVTDRGIKADPTRLHDLQMACPAPAQAPWYAEQVATAAGLRRIQSAGVAVQQLGGTMTDDLAAARERARGIVDAATAGRDVTKARTLAQVMPDVIDHAERGPGAVLGTGWPDLDRLIGGLAPGRIVIVGARPGVGKSVMGTNLALHVARKHGHAVLLSSLEMSELEVGQRLLAAHAGVDLGRLSSGTLEGPAWERIAGRAQELADLPITVNDSPAQTVTTIRRAARDVQRKRDDLALIVVDYLQLVQPFDSRANRAEQVAEISRGLKLLARESGACVVAMAQVNREAIKARDGRPRMSDLRESGAIEADADVVILLHPMAKDEEDDNPDVEVIVDKNRHGPKGVATLQLQGHYARLASVGWSPTRGITA